MSTKKVNRSAPSITERQFQTLQNLFTYLNNELFKSELQDCILNFSRKSKAMGFFAPYRWKPAGKGDQKINEISLNPEYLDNPVIQYVQTTVHEMCHLWQYQCGKPTPGYHNKEFAEKMKLVGLQPSSTGAPGGKEIGKKMCDYPIEGGVFLKVFASMPKDLLLPFICSPEVKQPAKPGKNKTKYVCLNCDSNVWGKEGLNIVCGDCETAFQVE